MLGLVRRWFLGFGLSLHAQVDNDEISQIPFNINTSCVGTLVLTVT
jgi:hypothetical protein